MSPSMDILISSNLERLLYLSSDAEATAGYMAELNSNGKYTVSDDIKSKISENFVGYYADEAATAETINKYFNKYGYLADTPRQKHLEQSYRTYQESVAFCGG